jgi:small subunit ribosomal protein S9
MITVNGKPLLHSLFMPMQRQRILTPLSVTSYTCLLDVNLKVWGGGYNGQVEAIIPAISKAIMGFDQNTRRTLKYFGLMKHDTRQTERKKIGKQKARKANVFRKR